MRTRVHRLHDRRDKSVQHAIKEDQVRSAFAFIMDRGRDGHARRGAIVFAAALTVFVAALMYSSSSAYGAPEAKPPPKKAVGKKPTKKKPKVEASVRPSGSKTTPLTNE